MTANTTYHVRAYAKNRRGTSYGKDLSFKTLAPNSYAINVSANPAEGGTVEGSGGYTQGQSCTVKATANEGYTFVRWTENGNQVSTDANYTFTVSSDRTLTANFKEQGTVPVGVIDGVFTINDNGDKVFFSQGNLQYIGSASTWKFAEHQWEVVGKAQDNSTSSQCTRDLFGWGTSGWNCGNIYYRPYDTDDSEGYYYGPAGNYDLTGSYANSDWGIYNPISNGGNQAGLWRTLTSAEWIYLFNTREGSSINGEAHARYAKASVNGMAGMILFPDDYIHPDGVPEPNGINDSSASFYDNDYESNYWRTMEEAGCVFLPAAGYRVGTEVGLNGIYGPSGAYWSVSYYEGYAAYMVYFGVEALSLGDWYNRLTGVSVRLVRNAQ